MIFDLLFYHFNFFIFLIFEGPIGSSLTNRFGCRITTIFGATIATIGFVLSVFAERLFVLYITIGFVVGIGFGLVYVPAIVSVGKCTF